MSLLFARIPMLNQLDECQSFFDHLEGLAVPVEHESSCGSPSLDFPSCDTARDRAEQALAVRESTDAGFRAFMAGMTWNQREGYIDAQCGRRPGRQPHKKKTPVYRHPIPDGMLRMEEAAAILGSSYVMVSRYMSSGVRRHGRHAKLRFEKCGCLNLTRPEWVAEFKREAFWLAIDKVARVENKA